MNEAKLKKLRGYYHSLLGVQRVFDDAAATQKNIIEAPPVEVLSDEIGRIDRDFPNLLPPFDAQQFFVQLPGRKSFYNVSGIRSYLGMALARLKTAIDVPGETSVTQSREFTFVSDPEVQKVLERDYSEIQRAFLTKCWKSVIILSGGALEAMLTDLLLQHKNQAKSASSAPGKSDITKWDLVNLIQVSVELELVSPGVDKLSHSVREYRNLVHPGNEIRKGLTFDQEEARIAIEVLHMVHRDLSS